MYNYFLIFVIVFYVRIDCKCSNLLILEIISLTFLLSAVPSSASAASACLASSRRQHQPHF